MRASHKPQLTCYFSPNIGSNTQISSPSSGRPKSETNDATSQSHMIFEFGNYRVGLHNLSSNSFGDLAGLSIPLTTTYLMMRLALKTGPVATGLGVGARPMVLLTGSFGIPLVYGALWAFRRRQSASASDSSRPEFG